MSKSETEYLKKFYNLLRDNLRREKSLKDNSVLISFLETRSASRYKLLNNSMMSSGNIPKDALMALLSKGFVQVLGKIDAYAITAKGAWHYEKELGFMNEDRLLSYINEKFFSTKQFGTSFRNDLDDREAVILFAMIAARAFSEKSSVDLKKSDVVKGKWQEVLAKTYDVLDGLQILDRLKKKDFLEKTGNEHIVSSIFRHNNQMVQKTRGIYEYTGRQEYYLDICENSIFSQEKLGYLFWKIFKGDISSEVVDTVIEYCNEISSRESIYLFDMKEHIFSMPVYDSLVKDSLLDSIFSKAKWAKIS